MVTYVFAPEVEGESAEKVFDEARKLALLEMAKRGGKTYEIRNVKQIAPNKWRATIIISG
jgi:hypothetical protein